ncbi:MAG: hypothetical protein LUF02_02450 [Erysipelotrichaceae bacterium]|nr:hypothetical protein [Erysipelotrichaceae bacterium]
MKKYLIILLALFIVMNVLISGIYIQCIPRLKEYGQFEMERLNQLIVAHSTSDGDYNDLLIIERNIDDEIDLLEFDMVKVNQLASQIVLDLENTYTSIEEGTYHAKDDSYYERRIENIAQSGIVTQVAFSTLLNIPSFISPTISICYKNLTSISSAIHKSIGNYGINHVMVELSIEVHMNLTMIYPFFEQYDTHTITIPILLEIFQGQVPLIYNY